MLKNNLDTICVHPDHHLAPLALTSSHNKLTSPTTYPAVSLPLPHQPFPPPSSINPTNTHVSSWPAACPLPLPTCSPAFPYLARPMAFLHTSSLLQHPSPPLRVDSTCHRIDYLLFHLARFHVTTTRMCAWPPPLPSKPPSLLKPSPIPIPPPHTQIS